MLILSCISGLCYVNFILHSRVLLCYILSCISGLCFVNFILHFRVVNEIDRSATQGAKQFFTRAFGFLLGPIIFGSIIDSYCETWRGGGGASGSCLIYDLERYVDMIQLCSVIFLPYYQE